MTPIVHLVSGLSIGGTEMMLYKLLRDTDLKAFPSSVVSLTRPGAVAERIRALGVPVSSLNMRRGIPNPAAIWRLYRILRRTRPAEKPPSHSKYWQELLGQVGGRVRLPMLELTDAEKQATRLAFETCGLKVPGSAQKSSAA